MAQPELEISAKNEPTELEINAHRVARTNCGALIASLRPVLYRHWGDMYPEKMSAILDDVYHTQYEREYLTNVSGLDHITDGEPMDVIATPVEKPEWELAKEVTYRPELTPAEDRMLNLTSIGLTAEEIARETSWSEKAITRHRLRVREKLGAKTMAHAVRRAFERGVWDIGSAIDYKKYVHVYTMLSPLQREIIRLMSLGHTTKMIAKQQRLSEHTIEIYRSSTIRTLGAKNGVHAVRIAIEAGIINLDPKDEKQA